MIGLGTAPLDDPQFRAALFEQLGEHRLEAAVTTDICGKKDSHAIRLDNEAVEAIRKGRIHRKVATSIFFESNGGIAKADASAPEIRLDVAEPEIDIGNIETALEALTDACYYLTVERNRYHFSFRENLNKRYADRRANIKAETINDRVREEIAKVFSGQSPIERVFFPERSNQVPDRAALDACCAVARAIVGGRNQDEGACGVDRPRERHFGPDVQERSNFYCPAECGSD